MCHLTDFLAENWEKDFKVFKIFRSFVTYFSHDSSIYGGAPVSRGDSEHALPPNTSGAPTRSSDVHEMTSIAVISSVAGAGGGGSSGGGPFRNNGGAGGVVSSAMPTSSGAAGTSTTMHL